MVGKKYRWTVHRDFQPKLKRWKANLLDGSIDPGRRVSSVLGQRTIQSLTPKDLFEVLVQSREPTRYAESEVKADGTDWTVDELALLGDMGFACEVEVFDDGRHALPNVHKKSFNGLLLFMSGALLRNDFGRIVPDYQECVVDGTIQSDAFQNLIARRIRPLLKYASQYAKERDRSIVVTVPGVGCGQFAGSVGSNNDIPKELSLAIERLLNEEGEAFTHIACVRFDSYASLKDSEKVIHGISYRVRPHVRSLFPRAQLSEVSRFEEQEGEFANCLLASVVAWDPVSWPGNDFYIGNRATDDGVKAAATSLMREITGVKGEYVASREGYYPVDSDDPWEQIIRKNELKLVTRKCLLAEK